MNSKTSESRRRAQSRFLFHRFNSAKSDDSHLRLNEIRLLYRIREQLSFKRPYQITVDGVVKTQTLAQCLLEICSATNHEKRCVVELGQLLKLLTTFEPLSSGRTKRALKTEIALLGRELVRQVRVQWLMRSPEIDQTAWPWDIVYAQCRLRLDFLLEPLLTHRESYRRASLARYLETSVRELIINDTQANQFVAAVEIGPCTARTSSEAEDTLFLLDAVVGKASAPFRSNVLRVATEMARQFPDDQEVQDAYQQLLSSVAGR